MTEFTADQQNRQRALDPVTSFIVQAPAGSGKTELLTQRFLALLVTVQQGPEEIIAITFTRKAAAEMRQRIINALTQAQNTQNQTTTISAHPQQQLTLQLAQAVLEKDQQANWNILHNPNRLRIFTIDALGSRVSAYMPILAGFGANPEIAEKAQSYYQLAVKELLLQFNSAPPWQSALSYLLRHLDNRTAMVEQLLIDMLARREQWLPYLVGQRPHAAQLRQRLEQGLNQLISEHLHAIHSILPLGIAHEWVALANIAGAYFAVEDPNHPLVSCQHLHYLPAPEGQHLAQWQALASLLLTQKGEWRRKVDKRDGFPAEHEQFDTSQCKINKQRLLELLAELSSHTELQQLLAELMNLPNPKYSQQQWQLITSLTELLPLLVAQLRLIFQRHGIIDFVELGLAAVQALGDDENPTDLALYLDHQIRHLLVDEFQDTSLTQFKLLQRLVAGWQEGDGRTIFLVGDPMQSIYRFRNAEVGLFLRAQQQGIAGIQLQALTLQRNFRSQAAIVDWVNTSFAQIMPAQADMILGAVSYTPVQATQFQYPEQSGVHYYPLLAQDNSQEAEQIVAIIKQYQQLDPDASIAILARSRLQLATIISVLRQQQFNFEAIAIEPLSHYAEIQDLTALTRALLHRADRLAWLSLLRAPWCGLTLADLLVIANAAEHTTLWQALCQYSQLALSTDAQLRLQRIVPALTQILHQQGRLPLAQWLESAWLVLGGPATVTDESALTRVQTFFRLLDSLSQSTPIFPLERLEQELEQLYADTNVTQTSVAPLPGPSDACHAYSTTTLQIQLMTIHKAKGLEFDHVIIPGLAQQVAADPARLLLWLERPNLRGSSDLIMAPVRASSQGHDSIYDYLRHVEKQKLNYESRRLLYVAVTRAKKSLHLIASISPSRFLQQDSSPVAGSFLQMLWPLYQQTTLNAQQLGVAAATTPSPTPAPHQLKRLVTDWQLPGLATGEQPLGFALETSVPVKPFKLNMNSVSQRHIGTIIHESLQQIAGLTTLTELPALAVQQARWQQRLLTLGTPTHELEASIHVIQTAIEKTLADTRGSWILASDHKDAHNEYALSALIHDRMKHVIIDRTFIVNNVRWIIDYKTSIPHADESLENFLQREKTLYYLQLHEYAQVMSLRESLPIRLGLYFPVCSAWCEWDYIMEEEKI